VNKTIVLIRSLKAIVGRKVLQSIPEITRNIEFKPIVNPLQSFESNLIALLRINSLVYTIKGKSIFERNEINLSSRGGPKSTDNMKELFLLETLEIGLKRNSANTGVISLSNSTFLGHFFARTPLVLVFSFFLVLGMIPLHFVIELDSDFSFSTKKPGRLDLATEKIQLIWNSTVKDFQKKIIIISSDDERNLTENQITMIKHMGKAESADIVWLILQNSEEPYKNRKVLNEISYKSKIDLIAFAVQQSGIIIVSNELSLLVALLEQGRIVLAREDYVRSDYKWGKILDE